MCWSTAIEHALPAHLPRASYLSYASCITVPGTRHMAAHDLRCVHHGASWQEALMRQHLVQARTVVMLSLSETSATKHYASVACSRVHQAPALHVAACHAAGAPASQLHDNAHWRLGKH